MAELAHLSPPAHGPAAPPAPGPAGSAAAGHVLLEVLEAAQRLVAYCDNDPVGGTHDAELASIGLPTIKLERALRDLRRAVQAMNRAMVTEEGCTLLANLAPAPIRRIA